jgi:hypothetical protein
MEDKWSIKKVLESQGDVHKKVVNQSNSELPSSSPTRSPGAPHIQIDVQIAYDIRFGHSTYAKKAKEIIFLMALVSCPNKNQSHPQSSKQYRFIKPFLVLRHHFGPMSRVSSWSPLGMHPRVRP